MPDAIEITPCTVKASTRLWGPAMLFLPCGGPKRAALGEVITLTQLFLTNIAAHQRAAVLIDSVSEVLAGHADAFTLPALKLAFVDEIPFLHAIAE